MYGVYELLNDYIERVSKAPEKTGADEYFEESFLKLLKQAVLARGNKPEQISNDMTERVNAHDETAMRKRINELLSLISMLRQKLVMSGFDPAVAAQLSMAQTELMWLMMGM